MSLFGRCSNPIVAIVVPNDVYLTYSIFILTSAWRICSFPLNLRSDSPQSRAEELPATETSTEAPLMPLEGPPAYISLLSQEPFTIPPILSRPSGLPSNPRLAIGSSNPGQEFMLTPDSLRYLATIVQNLINQIHEIMLAHYSIEHRAELQVQEFQRQQATSQEITNLVAALLTIRHKNLTDRMKGAMDKQKMLAVRSDRILQALVDKASPELSEHEKKWFDELKRMKDEVAGAGRHDEGSLAARTRLVRSHLSLSAPCFIDMASL